MTRHPDPNHLGRYTWYVIFLLAFANFFNYMDRMALAVLAPSIKLDLHLSDGQLGLLTGLAFSVFYATCGIPVARWADRGTRRNIVALALAVWSTMTALSGAARGFWHLFLARVGIGAAEAGCIAPSQSILCDYVPLQRRPGVFALQGAGAIAGMMFGMVAAGALVEAIGWRWTFVVLGVPGVAFALVIRFTLREPRRGAMDGASVETTTLPFWQTVTVLWRRRTYRFLTFVFALNGFITYGLNQWWPSFYSRTFELSASSIGVYLGIAFGVGSTVGLLGGGLLANKVAQRDVRLPLKIGAAAITLAIPVALASLFVPSVMASMILVSVTACLWSIPQSAVTAMALSIVPAQVRATAGAINIFFAAVLGFGLGPLCVGVASDLLAESLGREALRYALLLPVSLLPGLAFCLYSATRTLLEDLQ
jgi:predicted MFS family arabinose efflux permease